ncbi:hypothetical protein J41TS4_05210 [Paenibacillus apis]|uniref:Uncharacterized protein n=1 Tax=Paenibacillus apis TaxID=1792174 RepID=A0A919XZW4_9BACL|nr:hypothetical protein J41TS4_05210 [Paenibacillus apis]
MNFWEKITGSDMTKEMKAFESRVKELPADYQEAWNNINVASEDLPSLMRQRQSGTLLSRPRLPLSLSFRS